MSKPLKTFITYSHEDDQKRKKLRTCLVVMERADEITLRDDSDINPGGRARQEDILKEVADSGILLYLVSAASLASENCNKELTEAVRVEKRIIPIILESCDWLNDRLSDFQALPDKGKPINRWQPESDGWQNVVDGIRKAVEEMQTQATASSETPDQEPPDNWTIQYGNLLMMIEESDRAIGHYSRAIELNPDHAAVYNNRGIAFSKNGAFRHAIEDFNKAINLKPNYQKAFSNRGIAYAELGEFESAIRDISQAIKLNPNYATAYNNLGRTYYLKCDASRAIENLNKAVALEPNLAEAYNNRGAVYLYKRKYCRAIEDFDKAIELKPNLAEAYNNRGAAYANKKDFRSAIADFDLAIQWKPDDAQYYSNRGMAHWEKGEYDLAITDLTKAVELDPDNADLRDNLCQARECRGN